MAAKKRAHSKSVSRKASVKSAGMVDNDTFLLTIAGAVFLALVIVFIF